MNKRMLLVAGILVGCWIILSVSLSLGKQLAQPASTENSWTTAFTETFTNTLSVWTFIDNTSTGHQWGVIPYSKTVGSTSVGDFGLWVTGGGIEGEQLEWPTGTYTNGMETFAIAGPVTFTNDILETRLRFDVFNNIDQTDVFSVALSLDGETFTDVMAVSADPSSWQPLEWTSSALHGADQLWIIFYFTSDDTGIDTGPLVDNILLEVRTESTVFLPFVKLDPTPTPTPTPTPLPDYTDHFDDPNSGWFIGPAMRLNRRVFDGKDVYQWEAVNWINYVNGEYQMYIPMSVHCFCSEGVVDTWFVRTVEYAPMPVEMYPLPQDYCVEASAYIAGDYDPNYLLGHWGLVFGGDAAKSQVYTFQVNSQGRYHMLHYYNYVYPGRREDSHFPGENIEFKLIDVGDEYTWGNPHVPMNNSHNHNTLKAAVRGNRVYPYINGQCVEDGLGQCVSADITGMPRDRVGILGASWEPTPVDVRFDYFWYDPFCPEVQ